MGGHFMQLSDSDANEGTHDAAPVPRTSITMVQSVETVDALRNELGYQMGWRRPSISVQHESALAHAEAGRQEVLAMRQRTEFCWSGRASGQARCLSKDL